jgi:hypothetical protein
LRRETVDHERSEREARNEESAADERQKCQSKR